ncbi:MAG TPA: LysE family transporter, partial [Actinomycetota bacterium]|nr:LysE family transporter [Actinomycetota bacterium]
MLGQLVAFLGVSAVVICVPGPDTALTVRNALAGGRRCGVATAAGVAAGQAVWTLATSVGIAELIQASEPAFLVMRTVGAAYLVALGLQSLWTASGIRFPGRLRSPTGGPGTGPGRSRAPAGPDGSGPGARQRMRPGRALRQGMVSNLANPKMAAFLGVSAVVICVPGPDTALTVRNALAGGRRCGVATAAGVAAGQAVWT